MATSTSTEPSELQELLRQLDVLRSEMIYLEATSPTHAGAVAADHRPSAANLMHYVALRRHDIRQLQAQLAALGLSSLGRTESNVISALYAVMRVLSRLAGLEGIAPDADSAAPPLGDGRELLLNGMNCMRINCAHDCPEAWEGMIRNLRRAEKETGKACKVEMDIAGPKLRTGPIEPGPRVLKFRPMRDAFGRVTQPARVWLTPSTQTEQSPAEADAILPVPGEWLARVKRGDCLRFTDARGAKRALRVTATVGRSRWAESRQTAYVTPRTVLHGSGRGKGRPLSQARIGPLPPLQQTLRLRPGDLLFLTRKLAPGTPARYDKNGNLIAAARLGITLSEFFDCVRPGEPVWFDDGKIGGVVTEAGSEEVTVSITQARPTGEKLGGEKGVNVPETNLRLSALTAEDLKALRFVVQHADLVGFSFVRSEDDVRTLQTHLEELGGEHLGIVLKIETRQGFEDLPRLLLAAMRSRAVGVMIARGDLAVECGYQRLAEAQEEILWICEAAHMPVIWATQVLESLAKGGIPSRSEITDAAMGERAECVMLNKGPYIVEAVRSLDDILRRMHAHQDKKRSMLRKLNVATAFAATASR